MHLIYTEMEKVNFKTFNKIILIIYNMCIYILNKILIFYYIAALWFSIDSVESLFSLVCI